MEVTSYQVYFTQKRDTDIVTALDDDSCSLTATICMYSMVPVS